MAIQKFTDVMINWTRLPDSPSPIIEYTITIDGSTVLVPGNESQYTRPINDSECGSSLEIIMSATSAAGTGSNTTMILTIVSTRECCTVMSS